MTTSPKHVLRRARPFGSALLAAVVATGLLWAGGARASLEPDDIVDCQALGPGICVQLGDPDNLGDPFLWTETATGSDVLFSISSDPSSLIVTIQDQANAENLTGAGFILSEIEPLPDTLVQIESVDYMDGDNAEWTSFPTADPFVVNSGLPGNMATIEWTDLAGADFSSEQPGGLTARINLTFVSEPPSVPVLGGPALGLLIGTMAVLTAGVYRSRRNA